MSETLSESSPFELLDAAFRKACALGDREDLLALGTFRSTSAILSALMGADDEHPHECYHCSDTDESRFGVTFALRKPDRNEIDLGRIDYDSAGEALRFRQVNVVDIDPEGGHSIANSYALSPKEMERCGLSLILGTMLETDEIKELERRTFGPLRALPIVSKLVELVAAETGVEFHGDIRRAVFHDEIDGDDRFKSRGPRALVFKLHSFSLTNYPDGDYFDHHSSGPVTLRVWVQPDADGNRVKRISARPYFGWWRSAYWTPDGAGLCTAEDLHLTHRRFFGKSDLVTVAGLLQNWGPLANRIAAELGTDDIMFEDAAVGYGSFLDRKFVDSDEVPIGPPTRAQMLFSRGRLPRMRVPVEALQATPSLVQAPSLHTEDYLLERVRSRPPANCNVLPGSTPVVAFGNWDTATFATLGLNPSRSEFIDSTGADLTSGRRFHTARSLGVRDISEMTDDDARKVLDSCKEYYQRNPYRRWFDVLEEVLQKNGASYYDGSACHLDVAQWATDPGWHHLDPGARGRLAADGAPFLRELLDRNSIQVLLLNGAGCISGFERATGTTLSPDGYGPITSGKVTCRFFESRIDGIAAIGWSTNLQSTFGVTRELRQAVGERVRMILWKYMT